MQLQYRKSFQRGQFHLGVLSIPIGAIAVCWVLFLTVSVNALAQPGPRACKPSARPRLPGMGCAAAGGAGASGA